MEETDYKEYLQSEPSDMSIPQMLEKLRKKLADEIDYVAAQSVGDLANFIKFIRMSYMIDNTIFMIEGVKNKAPPETLFLNMNPLGFYSEMKNIKVINNNITKNDFLNFKLFFSLIIKYGFPTSIQMYQYLIFKKRIILKSKISIFLINDIIWYLLRYSGDGGDSFI
jgi:hypothetical protein